MLSESDCSTKKSSLSIDSGYCSDEDVTIRGKVNKNSETNKENKNDNIPNSTVLQQTPMTSTN